MTVNGPAPKSGTMDVDRFMAFMQTRPKGEHWDLIDGVAVMMALASHAHQQIALNFCILLRSAFAAQGLDLRAIFNTGVRSPNTRYFQPEPDVAVIPGVAGYELYSENFQLAAEILSPSNSRQEIDLKLDFLSRSSRQPLRRRDRAAEVLGGNPREEPQMGAGDSRTP